MLNMMNDIITTVKERTRRIEAERCDLRDKFYDALGNIADTSCAAAFKESFRRWKLQYGDLDEEMDIDLPEDIMLMHKVDEVKLMLKRFRRDISPAVWNKLTAIA